MAYRHTQRGTLIMFLCLVLAAVDAAIAWRTGQWPPVAVLIILAAVAVIFSSLTVEVNGEELRWHFGPGFWTYRLALDEIETVAVVRPLFEVMGKTIIHQGPAGAGQHTKMVNQTLIASGMVGVCEALLYAYRADLDLETVLEAVSGGAAGSWSLSNYAPRMLKGDVAPGFMVDHFIKDMEITLGEARRMNLAMPGLALAHELYLALRAQGGGRDGTQSLIRALARISAVDWPGVV